MSTLRPRLPIFRVRNDYSTTPVTKLAFVTLVASLPSDVTQLEIFDSSGSVLELAYGPVGSEVVFHRVTPGGNTLPVQTLLNKGMSIYIRAVDVDATTGQLVMNGTQ